MNEEVRVRVYLLSMEEVTGYTSIGKAGRCTSKVVGPSEDSRLKRRSESLRNSCEYSLHTDWSPHVTDVAEH